MKEQISLELVFESSKVEEQYNSLKAASKLVGGNKRVALGILGRINALKQATTIKDIIVQPQLRFHKLDDKHRRKLKGYFAIDVTNKRCPWRLVLQPLDDDTEPFDPCNIDEIADVVKVVGILEVSDHYE